MKLRFWGVRGSIPTPGPATVRYGGNTTCLEVRTDEGDLIVLDGGTGIHPLALSLLKEMPIEANVFITHTHWDHIHGLPFFVPIFVPGNRITIHGPFDPVSGQGIEQVMAVQMQYSFFPVREAELKAQLDYRSLAPGESVTVGNATITPVLLNHPVINYGYRIDSGGKSLFFTGDHEPPQNIYAPGEDGHADYEALVAERQATIHEALRGIDVLVADCSYTTAEYASKRGWGHGTYASSIELARAVGAQRLICTHHEPTRSDDALEAAFASALAEAGLDDGLEVLLAKEGLLLEW